jgi:hypothetical protein
MLRFVLDQDVSNYKKRFNTKEILSSRMVTLLNRGESILKGNPK